jgi:AraC-like DNA-binding protein
MSKGEAQQSWMRRAPGALPRIEARFSGRAYAPHRHDTYAIGLTLEGIQSFDYRGAARHSLPGQLVVLHPDELHDGRAGDGGQFRYRTAYIAPADLQAVLGGRPLPFIDGGVSSHPALARAVMALLADLDHDLEPLAQADALYDLAQALVAASGEAPASRTVDGRAAGRARAAIDQRLVSGISLADLEAQTGRDRWSLSRDFRAIYGTSPYRYLIYRRLDLACAMLRDGHSCAQAAADCGFADQSHFTRHFKAAIGLTPLVWLKATGPAAARSFYTASRSAD